MVLFESMLNLTQRLDVAGPPTPLPIAHTLSALPMILRIQENLSVSTLPNTSGKVSSVHILLALSSLIYLYGTLITTMFKASATGNIIFKNSLIFSNSYM